MQNNYSWLLFLCIMARFSVIDLVSISIIKFSIRVLLLYIIIIIVIVVIIIIIISIIIIVII